MSEKEIINKINELKKEIKYEEKKMKICGYGKSDIYYLEDLKEQLQEYENRLEELE